MEKLRLDVAIVNRGLAKSREKAKALIMAGKVLVNEQKIDKSGTNIKSDAVIRILGTDNPFVSRGGLKLKKAMESFSLDLEGVVMADIGASTGGFTDCSLQKGAIKVYAVDVGYGQLDWKLRTDPRVINMERTNARYLTPEILGEKVDFVSIDVSFISLDKILPAVNEILKDTGEVIALIKPQFEAGKDRIGKKGVVRDPEIHIDVIKNIFELAKELNFGIKGLTYSPVKGPEGNIEYLLWLNKKDELAEIVIEDVVKEAHKNLKTN
ncbi:23S rRNA (cytidine1920-2'-O)/16S rRNA (cytidine1409-2'-O)-methyltransferase [Desulfonispora thiosulfatigenes DSM 11270]|uniref:23S rRNA (Cytidine1920-2'-O)/16S rRNA (Cytidine1409-2'-O)-methyltransferase n=1 Tax=Desulfonispora thiosulfatigenes DSM 11270 TaxID=656914 RepID=A0A1W1VNF5_DESTI|nr:TlyA family RNA methyltransferase [Desulfonispora thiosulfatigenes]SMB94915.1 23S rRNA (cytidine1920-2'-O)/16S rRNA (cytidine1409-2'-O)-methyltransferase [Desulfonispora thiosulfatigenes DSM 11270]